jgi:hypothetical protein
MNSPKSPRSRLSPSRSKTSRRNLSPRNYRESYKNKPLIKTTPLVNLKDQEIQNLRIQINNLEKQIKDLKTKLNQCIKI